MSEIIHLLFNPLPNGIMTVLLGISLLYWLFMLFTGDGFNFFDSDIDIATDGSPDVGDVDGADAHHAESDTVAEPSFFTKALDFINVGKVPIMLISTLFKFVSWLLTIATSLAVNVSSWGLKSIFILLPVFILTYFIIHFLTKPLAKFYKEIGYQGEEPTDFLGRAGKMKSTIQGTAMGSAEFVIQQDVFKLNVVSISGGKINYGDEVIIADESKDKRIFYVTKEINIHNI